CNVLILLASFLVIACSKDFLEKTPPGTLNKNTLATEEGVNGLLIGAYHVLNNGGIPGGGWASGKWIFGGVASDDAHTGTQASALQPIPLYEAYIHNPTTTSTNSRWIVLYTGVQRANDVLRLLSEIPESKISSDKAEQIKAEAIFLRGLYHLEAALM